MLKNTEGHSSKEAASVLPAATSGHYGMNSEDLGSIPVWLLVYPWVP